jgi:hypothetical protein
MGTRVDNTIGQILEGILRKSVIPDKKWKRSDPRSIQPRKRLPE